MTTPNNTATVNTASLEKLTKAELIGLLAIKEAEIIKLNEVSKEPAKSGNLNISKGEHVPLDILNSQLVRIRGMAGNVKVKAKQMNKESLLSSVTEITGDQAFLMDERSISPLQKGEVITKEQAAAFRAYARLVKACQLIVTV